MQSADPSIDPVQRGDIAPIRTLLIDDSRVARAIFARVLTDNSDIQISAEASSAAEALNILTSVIVDVILLDIEMPDRSGLDALQDILEASHGARVIVVSSYAEHNGEAALRALALGACDTLAKPGLSPTKGRFSECLREKVLKLGRVNSERKSGPKQTNGDTILTFQPKPSCVAIGSSTGGIPAIYHIVENLDAQLPCPVIIAQHLPESFIEVFARQLAARSALDVTVARVGAKVLAGQIYVMPGSEHVTLKRLNDEVIFDCPTQIKSSPYCPSVDHLFHAVASVYGNRALALVLSGMGCDGLQGVQLLRERGAVVLAQDKESSVVWGMPGSIARLNLASAIMSPSEMSRQLQALTQ